MGEGVSISAALLLILILVPHVTPDFAASPVFVPVSLSLLCSRPISCNGDAIGIGASSVPLPSTVSVSNFDACKSLCLCRIRAITDLRLLSDTDILFRPPSPTFKDEIALTSEKCGSLTKRSCISSNTSPIHSVSVFWYIPPSEPSMSIRFPIDDHPPVTSCTVPVSSRRYTYTMF